MAKASNLVIGNWTFTRGPRADCAVCQVETVGRFVHETDLFPCCPGCRENGKALLYLQENFGVQVDEGQENQQAESDQQPDSTHNGPPSAILPVVSSGDKAKLAKIYQSICNEPCTMEIVHEVAPDQPKRRASKPKPKLLTN